MDINLYNKLKRMAIKLTPEIEEQFAERATSTARQQFHATKARNYGVHLQRTQQAINILAEFQKDGSIPEILKDLATKTEIHKIMEAKMDGKWNDYFYAWIDTGIPKDQSEKSLALWSLIPGQSEGEKEAEALKRRIDLLKFAGIPGYLPTPESIIDLMIAEAKIESHHSVLEPSAGAGHIADRIRENFPGIDLSVVEVWQSLRNILKGKGHNLKGLDFLNWYVEKKYDRIIMNPPFKNRHDIFHVLKAYEYLKLGGRLVSIMSIWPFVSSDKKSIWFRDWLKNIGSEVKDLPGGSFKQSGTSVSTKMLIIDK